MKSGRLFTAATQHLTPAVVKIGKMPWIDTSMFRQFSWTCLRQFDYHQHDLIVLYCLSYIAAELKVNVSILKGL